MMHYPASSSALKKFLMEGLHQLSHLFFPHPCPACYRPLLWSEGEVCTHCLSSLSYPENHHSPFHNPVQERLDILFPFKGSIYLYAFTKKGLGAQLLYDFKYKGNQALGQYLSEMMLNRWPELKTLSLDCIVPVPLHYKKQRLRGYNQAEVIAQRLAQLMEIPLQKDLLHRKKQGSTQTKKHRQERFESMKGLYAINKRISLKGQRVLLVDDVVTTGATLETCALLLKELGADEIYTASIALAN